VHRVLRVLPSLAAVVLLVSSALAAPSVGSKAPDFTAKELTGKTFRLSQFRGNSPIILNFFSIT
jgi:peroxiredoxin